MFKMIVKIFYSFVILVTGIALIGVNVSQLYCSHCEDTHFDVSLLPQEEGCLCKDNAGCCGDDCSSRPLQSENSRHDFYKIADTLRTENENNMPVLEAFFILAAIEYSPFSPTVLATVIPLLDLKPDILQPREMLCIYRC